MAMSRLNIVIFGATGFTGKYTVKEAARLAEIYQFTWGIAGRRRDALEDVLRQFGLSSENIPIIIADLKDEESIKKMTESADVIVNCCGPYRFYGETVVKSCIATKTHHVDVSGEPQFIENMQLKYNEAAKTAGVYVISACGFDSIPCDLGIIFVQQKFDGEVNSVETYLSSSSKSNVKSSYVNYGTYESAVYGLAHYNELSELRRKLFPKKLPELKPKLRSRGVHCSSLTGKWTAPFLGADRAVALRSQRFLFENYKKRPAQVQCYVTFSSFFSLLLIGIFGGVFKLFTKFALGRRMLLRYPKFFTLGFVTNEGPSEELIKNVEFAITIKGSGWTEKLNEPTDNHVEPPNKEMIAKVSGPNPGYGTTCIALLLSGIMILKQKDKMPDEGGVLPPGAAFSETTMIEELQKNGVKFEILSTTKK